MGDQKLKTLPGIVEDHATVLSCRGAASVFLRLIIPPYFPAPLDFFPSFCEDPAPSSSVIITSYFPGPLDLFCSWCKDPAPWSSTLSTAEEEYQSNISFRNHHEKNFIQYITKVTTKTIGMIST